MTEAGSESAAAYEPYAEGSPFTYAFGQFAALEALAHRPRDVTGLVVHRLLPERWRQALEAAAARAGVPVTQDDGTVVRLRRHGQVHCLARVTKRDDRVLEDRDHVVLVAPSHAGNVGSALRSLAAFGFDDVALIGPRVDHWGPHVVRASVGMRFALRCETFADAAEYQAAFPDHHVYAFCASGGRELGEVRFERPCALWFGPEWPGGGAVGAPSTPTTTVRIRSRSRVESLNLAVAVSLAAYHGSRDAGDAEIDGADS